LRPSRKLDLWIFFFLLTNEVQNFSQWLKQSQRDLKLEPSKLERVKLFCSLELSKPIMLQEAASLTKAELLFSPPFGPPFTQCVFSSLVLSFNVL